MNPSLSPVRTLVLLLLLANLSFFAFTRLDASRDGEAGRLAEQVQPDKIKLLTPQQVAALGPAKVAALADVCLEWGPLSEPDRARAFADLEPLSLGKLLTQRRIETAYAFWVYPAASRESRRSRAARRRSEGEGYRRRVGRRRRTAAFRRVARSLCERGRRAGTARAGHRAGRGEREGRPRGSRWSYTRCWSCAIPRRR